MVTAFSWVNKSTPINILSNYNLYMLLVKWLLNKSCLQDVSSNKLLITKPCHINSLGVVFYQKYTFPAYIGTNAVFNFYFPGDWIVWYQSEDTCCQLQQVLWCKLWETTLYSTPDILGWTHQEGLEGQGHAVCMEETRNAYTNRFGNSEKISQET